MAYKIKNKPKKARRTSSFRLPKQVKSEGEARSLAIEYQNWASNQSMSYGELAYYQNYFEKLGKRFNLTAEFSENGII
jgi:hypothetical protein